MTDKDRIAYLERQLLEAPCSMRQNLGAPIIDNVLTVALKRSREDALRLLREGRPSQYMAAELTQIIHRIDNALLRWRTEQ